MDGGEVVTTWTGDWQKAKASTTYTCGQIRGRRQRREGMIIQQPWSKVHTDSACRAFRYNSIFKQASPFNVFPSDNGVILDRVSIHYR